MRVKAKIKMSLMMILLFAALAATGGTYFPALLLSVAIHESGHIVLARLRKIELGELKLGIFGAALMPTGMLFSYADEILLCLGGPLFNFLSVAIAMLIFAIPSSSLFIHASLALGFLNMLPIIGFDGGRILSVVLEKHFSLGVAISVMKKISFVLIFSLWVFSLYVIMRAGASVSIFIFSASMFARIFLQERI